MKRTVTVTFELTRSQVNKIKLLGSMLWPGQNLPYPEICRRVLLDGADRRLVSQLPPGERLLEATCKPSSKARVNEPEMRNPILTAVRS
jgi:hypothetical protein